MQGRPIKSLISIWIIGAALLSEPARAQGFANLGTGVDGYADVVRGRELTFPGDHGPHDDFRIEWWYVTANLTDDETGEPYGVQWTLFRSALRPPIDPTSESRGAQSPWASPQIYMGHAAITTAKLHVSAERFGRSLGDAFGDPLQGQAGVVAGSPDAPFTAWIDDWRFSASTDETNLANAQMTARGDSTSSKGEAGLPFSFKLDMKADGPLVRHGENGVSVKAPSGQASYYYSQPFYTVTGEIEIDSKARQVSGKAWMDREWSSQLLSGEQTGWDWFSLHFDSGAKAMLFRLRADDGAPYYSGSWIEPDGTTTPIDRTQISFQPEKTKRIDAKRVPVVWRLAVPSRDLDILVTALNPDSAMRTTFPYWEGPVRITGSHEGVGYLEMTGYIE